METTTTTDHALKTKNENDKIDLFSRARTVLAAVRRLRLLLDGGGQQNRRRRFFRLRVLVLGADRNEGATDVETERIFKRMRRRNTDGRELGRPERRTKDFLRLRRGVRRRDDDYGPKGVHVAERERCLFHERKRPHVLRHKERERERRKRRTTTTTTTTTTTRRM